MSNAELDNLIDAFLSGELDDAGRERLAVLLESEPSARRQLDDALHTESLLHAVHNNANAEQRAIDKLKRRLAQVQPAALRPARPVSVKRPAVTNRFARPQRSIRPGGRATIGIWTALAASIAILFGLAFYFIYEPANNSGGTADTTGKNGKSSKPEKDGKKNDLKRVDYTVASGRVKVDGKDAREIAENEWVSVASDAPAALRAKDGSNITLEAGTRAVLRTRGATLMSGAGRFNVISGTDPFVLQTPLATVNSNSGEFGVRLDVSTLGDTGTNRRGGTLEVTVATGSADVEFEGKTTQLSAGKSRMFRETIDTLANTANANLKTEPSVARFRPREMNRIDCIFRHEKELLLTEEQKSMLNDIAKRLNDATELVVKDSVVRELFAKQVAAESSHDEPSIHEYQKRIHERSIELLGPDRITNDPMELLDDIQRRKMELFERDRDRTPGPRNGNDPPRPPPRPPFPPAGNEVGRPPPQ